jgi:hypothetical protein
MAFVVADRVKQYTTTTGNGSVTLSGVAPGFQSFSIIGNGNVTYYCIYDPTLYNWEVGIGTYTSAGNVLSRSTILDSSSGGSAISFSAGTKEVFVVYPAERSVLQVGSAIQGTTNGAIYLNSKTVSLPTTVPTNFNGTSVGPITVASGASVTVEAGAQWGISSF